VRAFPR